MAKVGIIICGRYQTCGGGKCLRAMKHREGAFSIYPAEEELELVGYSYCGGCPGGNVEYVPAEMVKNGATVIHLATGLVVGYPPCTRIRQFKEYIEKTFEIPVVVGTHPIPMKYFTRHGKLTHWNAMKMRQTAPELFKDSDETMICYN